jgi:hypothetical protein
MLFPVFRQTTQESIAHQYNRNFYNGLVVGVENLIVKYEELGKPTRKAEFSSLKNELEVIVRIVKKETGILLDLGIDTSPDTNAWVDIGPLGINHPFFKWAHDHFDVSQSDINADKVVAKLIADSNEAIGWVDRKNGKVGGIFNDIEFESKLTYGLLRELPAEQVTGILLHEIGHAFTMLEFLTGMLTRNYALGSIAQVIAKQSDSTVKVLLLNKVKSELENNKNYPHLSNNEYQTKTGRKFTIVGDILDVQTAVEVKTEEELAIYLINASVKPFYSENGNYFYDTSGAEFLADQFATRCGAGSALVEGLHLIYRGSIERSLFIQVCLNILELLVLSNPFIAILILTTIALTPYPIKQYDDPKDRIIRIRNEMVDALKNPDIDNKTKKRYVDDIEKCNVLLREYNRFFSIIAFVSRVLFPSKRKMHNDMLLQKKIEALGNSNLFTTATKYELLN